jgi:hypothetical protein
VIVSTLQIRRRALSLFLSLIIPLAIFAQGTFPPNSGGGVTVGGTLPATCTVGQLYSMTTVGATQGLNQCLIVNTWSVIAGGATVAWGAVTGTLSSQTDLNSALISRIHVPNTGAIWSSGTAYAVNDVAIDTNSQLYLSITAGTNHEPSTSPTYWTPLSPYSTTAVTNFSGVYSNGSADSTAGIQGALNNCGTLYGTLVIPYGTYLTSDQLYWGTTGAPGGCNLIVEAGVQISGLPLTSGAHIVTLRQPQPIIPEGGSYTYAGATIGLSNLSNPITNASIGALVGLGIGTPAHPFEALTLYPSGGYGTQAMVLSTACARTTCLWSIPDSSGDTFVGLATTATLTNKTVDGLSAGAGAINFSGATHTVPTIVAGTFSGLPTSGCGLGELAVVTGATLGQQIYENSGSGTCVWTQQLNSGGGGSSAFSSLTGGTNTGAAMLVGSGATLGVTGSGTISASTLSGGATNDIPYQAGSGTTGFIAPANSAVLITNGSGVPSESTTLPSGLAMQTPASINLANGTALPLTGMANGSSTGQFNYWNGSAWTALAGNTSGTKQLQETSSGVPSWVAASGGGTGDSAQHTAASSTAGMTYTCNSASAGTLDQFVVTMTTSITSATLASCTPGQDITWVFIQPSTGGTYNYTAVMPSGVDACQLGAGSGIVTTCKTSYDGTLAHLVGGPDYTCPGCAGALRLPGNTTLPTILANTFYQAGPATASFTGYGIQWPSTPPVAGDVLFLGAPSSGWSQATYAPYLPGQAGQDFAITLTTTTTTNDTLTVAPGNHLFGGNPFYQQNACNFTLTAGSGTGTGVVSFSRTGFVTLQYTNVGGEVVTKNGTTTNCDAVGASAPAFPGDGSLQIGTVLIASANTWNLGSGTPPFQQPSLGGDFFPYCQVPLLCPVSGDGSLFSLGSTVMQSNEANPVTSGFTLTASTGAGTINLTGAAHTTPTIVVATAGSLPSTGCVPGEQAMVTGALPGQQGYSNTGTGSCVWIQGNLTGTSNVLNVTANQSAVTLATSPAAGPYRIEYYGDLHTAQSGCVVSYTFNWHDVDNARVLTTGNLALSSQSTSGYISGLLPIWVNGSTNVTYTSTMTGCGTGAYAISVILEAL